MTAPPRLTSARDGGLTLAALASALAIPGVPALLVLAVFAEHVASFHGVCGPYPMDIPAYPCGLSDYVAGFAEPFALAGLFALSVVLAAATTVVLAVAWSIAALAWALARARRSAPTSSLG